MMFIKTTLIMDRTNDTVPLTSKNGFNYYQFEGTIAPNGTVAVEFTEVTSEAVTPDDVDKITGIQSQIDDIASTIADILGGAV